MHVQAQGDSETRLSFIMKCPVPDQGLQMIECPKVNKISALRRDHRGSSKITAERSQDKHEEVNQPDQVSSRKNQNSVSEINNCKIKQIDWSEERAQAGGSQWEMV